ncbi:MAG: hypothetical protein K8E24_006610 [Methanobacterium paludis]|nr:hypothetical protein [Methanobacterium paludis]
MDENQDHLNALKSLKFLIKEREEPKKSSYIIAVIVNLILLYIFNSIPSWNISFITGTFRDVLLIFNLSVIVTITGNILFLIYSQSWFRNVMQAIMHFLGFLVAYTFYVVFPFNFSQEYVVLSLKFALIVIMIVMVVLTIVEVLKFILKILEHFLY